MALVAQIALVSVVCASMFFVYRWIRSRAPVAASLFAAGFVARAAVGAGLAMTWLASATPGAAFMPDTRWFPDAQMYYEEAAAAVMFIAPWSTCPVFAKA